MSDAQRTAFIDIATATAASAAEPELRYKRSRLDLTPGSPRTEIDDEDSKSTPPAVIPLLARFPGIPRAPIVALYDNVFSPRKDLLKLRTAEFRSSAPEKDYHYVTTPSGLALRPLS
jgi:hypothetical protein